MAGQDNMVITNRIREEIGRFRKLQDHLRPTEVRLGLVAQQLPFRGKVAGQVSGDLEYRYGPSGTCPRTPTPIPDSKCVSKA